MGNSTMAVSHKLKEKLNSLKTHHRQTYEDVIWELIKEFTGSSEKKKTRVKKK